MSVSERILVGLIAFCVALISPSIFTTFGGMEMAPGWHLVGVGLTNPIQLVSILIITIATYFNINALLWLSSYSMKKSKYTAMLWRVASGFAAFGTAFLIHSGIRSATTWIEFWSIGKNPFAAPSLREFPAFTWECALIGVFILLVVRWIPGVMLWLAKSGHNIPADSANRSARTMPTRSF